MSIPVIDLRSLNPQLNEGKYVFSSVLDIHKIPRTVSIMEFQEEEGTTVILSQEDADRLGLEYNYVAAWITLKANTALDAVGITATFARLLADHEISCNVVAGFHHDHIFVPYVDRLRAIQLLTHGTT
jgi:hypothetical protein